MHELSLAMALVEQAAAVLDREGASRAVSLTVRIGAWSGVDAEAFAFAFPAAAEGTPLAGARLLIEPEPLHVHCQACGALTEPVDAFPCCAACGAVEVEVRSGHAFDLRSMDVA
jgi:hydrogenase nickel incorporation protein HypA/HybF